MKLLILIFALLGLTCTIYAQDNSLKLSTKSFEKTYRQQALVIDVRQARKSPTLQLSKTPDIIWKHHPETLSYYNNHRANSFCFNQSNGWKMIQVRPMQQQLVFDVAAIGTGLILGSILEALSKR